MGQSLKPFKDGGRFDLAIFRSALNASNCRPQELPGGPS
jgi:hypothetical protein